jgi:hypothetical protein
LFVSAEILEELFALERVTTIVCVGRSVGLSFFTPIGINVSELSHCKLAEILNWERKKSVA